MTAKRFLLPVLLLLVPPWAVQAQDQPPPAAAAVDVAPSPQAMEAAPRATAPAEVAPPRQDAPAPAADGQAADTPADGGTADGTTAPAEAAAAADPRTQEERDFQALYGDPSQAYDPVYDPSLPEPVQLPGSYDPWERLNRRTHAFNNVVDRTIALPLARAYVAVAPRPVRLGVSNFFNNLGQPLSALNAMLQGKPVQAGQSLGRFLVNSTVGLAGFFDPATRMRIPNRSEDFGQTLGVWGWERSRYVELPLFGPRTVRDVFGLVGDGQLSPIRHIEEDKVRVFTQGLQLVDVRTQLMAIDSLREGASDEYALFRDSWMQRRNYQIHGDRMQHDEALPDYLRDDSNPTVPADAMPIIPGTVP